MKKILVLCFVACSLASMLPPIAHSKLQVPKIDYDQKMQNQFVEAIRQGNLAQVQRMLKFRPKISVNGMDDHNENPLEAAVLNGHHKIADLLLSTGAIKYLNTSGGMTPGTPLIVVAVEKGDADMVELLIAYGAKVDLVQNDKVHAVSIRKKLIDYVPQNHPNAQRIRNLLQGKTKIR
jgi:ankyrin repeat protein